MEQKDGIAKLHSISGPYTIPMSVPSSSTINHHILDQEENRITWVTDLFRYRQTCCNRLMAHKRYFWATDKATYLR